MDSTTVKIDVSDKQKLEKLQAVVTLKGKNMTQQELLSEIINKAFESGDNFVDQLVKDTVPMSNKDYQKLLSLSSDWGVSTKWQDIDDTLYGHKEIKEEEEHWEGKKIEESHPRMCGAIIDTNMFVSLANKRDQDHKKALEIFGRIRAGDFGQPYTSDYVFDESLTVALVRTGRVEESIRVGKMILGSKSEGIPALAKLISVDERIFAETWEVFQTGKMRYLSFTDHTILTQMKAYHLDFLLSFDSGFDGLVSRIGE